MVCKKCGNKLIDSTYCIRCGTENDEELKNNLLNEARREAADAEEFSKYERQISVVVLWVIIVVVLGVIAAISQTSYDSCVNHSSSTDCGLGALCARECNSTGHLLISFSFIISLIASFFGIPIYLALASKKYKKH